MNLQRFAGLGFGVSNEKWKRFQLQFRSDAAHPLLHIIRRNQRSLRQLLSLLSDPARLLPVAAQCPRLQEVNLQFCPSYLASIDAADALPYAERFTEIVRNCSQLRRLEFWCDIRGLDVPALLSGALGFVAAV